MSVLVTSKQIDQHLSKKINCNNLSLNELQTFYRSLRKPEARSQVGLQGQAVENHSTTDMLAINLDSRAKQLSVTLLPLPAVGNVSSSNSLPAYIQIVLAFLTS